MIFITSFLSLTSLLFTSSLSPHLFFSLLFTSPLRGLPLSQLWSFLRLVLLSFFSMFCVTPAAAAAVAARVAAVAGVLLLCCCWSPSLLVLLVGLERLFLVSGRFFFLFCLFSVIQAIAE